ncbi:MAG: hypothetical protein LKI39_02660 [Bacteroides sp.]|jgi:hypothetical protein|nr:hypothetical protein [Bacteroides sp.]
MEKKTKEVETLQEWAEKQKIILSKMKKEASAYIKKEMKSPESVEQANDLLVANKFITRALFNIDLITK